MTQFPCARAIAVIGRRTTGPEAPIQLEFSNYLELALKAYDLKEQKDLPVQFDAITRPFENSPLRFSCLTQVFEMSVTAIDEKAYFQEPFTMLTLDHSRVPITAKL